METYSKIMLIFLPSIGLNYSVRNCHTWNHTKQKPYPSAIFLTRLLLHPPPTCYYFKILQTYSFAPIFAYSLTMDYRIVHGLTLPPPLACPLSVIAIHVALEASLAQEELYKDYTEASSIKLLDKLKSVKLNTPEICLNKPHVVSAVISCHLPGYLTGCQIPGYLMENTRVFVNKAEVLKNTRVFFVKYPGIFQYPGNMTLHRVLYLHFTKFIDHGYEASGSLLYASM